MKKSPSATGPLYILHFFSTSEKKLVPARCIRLIGCSVKDLASWLSHQAWIWTVFFPMQKWNCYPTIKSLPGLSLCKIVTAQPKQNVLPFSSGGTTQEARSSSLGPLGLCHTFKFLLENVLKDDRLLKVNFLPRSLTSECPESVRYIQCGKARLVLLSALHKRTSWGPW